VVRSSLASRVFSGFILVCFSGNLFAQSLLPAGLDRRSLDRAYDRADQETDSRSWRLLAGTGNSEAVASWEQWFREQTNQNPEDANQAHAEITAWISSYTEERFADWLVKQFDKARPAQDYNAQLSASLLQANETWLYLHNADGSRLEPSSGRSTYKNTETLENDFSSWKALVQAGLNQDASNLANQKSTLHVELLSWTTSTGVDSAALEKSFDLSWQSKVDSFQSEQLELFRLEASRFYQLRSYDQSSLRKQNEDEQANTVAVKLAAETTATLENDLATLANGLQGLGIQGPDGTPNVNIDDWVASFRNSWKKGMETWDKAEKDLLASRLSWEQEAVSDYQKGEKAWTDAWAWLSDQRKTWETKLQDLTEKGSARFTVADASLADSIDRAGKEFDKAASERTAALGSQLETLTEVYLKASSTVRSAQDGLRFWKPRNDAAVNAKNTAEDSYAQALEAWEELKADIAIHPFETYTDPETGETSDVDRTLPPRPQLDTSQWDNEAINSYNYWQGVLTTYQTYLSSIDKTVLATYGVVLSESVGLYTNPDALFGQTGTDNLQGASTAAADSLQNAVLDSAQVALIKAGVLKDFWDKQYAIAAEVMAYANNLSSTRPDKTSTLLTFQTALEAMNTARSEYAKAVDTLKTQGSLLSEAQTAIDAKKHEVDLAQEALREATTKLQNQVAAWAAGETPILDKIAALYQTLSGFTGQDSVATKDKAVSTYFEAATMYGIQLRFADRQSNLQAVLNANQDTGQSSLADAISIAETVKNSGAFDSLPTVNQDDPAQKRLSALKASYDKATDQTNRALIAYQALAFRAHWVADLTRANDQRKATAAMLAAPNEAVWLSSCLGALRKEIELHDASGSELSSWLRNQATNVGGKCLSDRVALEQSLLKSIQSQVAALGKNETWTRSALPFQQVKAGDILTADAAASVYVLEWQAQGGSLSDLNSLIELEQNALRAIQNTLAATNDRNLAGDGELATKLRSLAAGDPTIRSFLTGKSLLDGVEPDLASWYFRDTIAWRDQLTMLLSLESEYADKIDYLRDANRNTAWTQINTALKNFRLPKVIPTSSPQNATAYVDLVNAINPLLSSLSETEVRQVQKTLQALATERIARYLADNPSTSLDFDLNTLQNETTSATQDSLQFQQFKDLSQKLANSNNESLSALSGLIASIPAMTGISEEEKKTLRAQMVDVFASVLVQRIAQNPVLSKLDTALALTAESQADHWDDRLTADDMFQTTMLNKLVTSRKLERAWSDIVAAGNNSSSIRSILSNQTDTGIRQTLIDRLRTAILENLPDAVKAMRPDLANAVGGITNGVDLQQTVSSSLPILQKNLVKTYARESASLASIMVDLRQRMSDAINPAMQAPALSQIDWHSLDQNLPDRATRNRQYQQTLATLAIWRTIDSALESGSPPSTWASFLASSPEIPFDLSDPALLAQAKEYFAGSTAFPLTYSSFRHEQRVLLVAQNMGLGTNSACASLSVDLADAYKKGCTSDVVSSLDVVKQLLPGLADNPLLQSLSSEFRSLALVAGGFSETDQTLDVENAYRNALQKIPSGKEAIDVALQANNEVAVRFLVNLSVWNASSQAHEQAVPSVLDAQTLAEDFARTTLGTELSDFMQASSVLDALQMSVVATGDQTLSQALVNGFSLERIMQINALATSIQEYDEASGMALVSSVAQALYPDGYKNPTNQNFLAQLTGVDTSYAVKQSVQAAHDLVSFGYGRENERHLSLLRAAIASSTNNATRAWIAQKGVSAFSDSEWYSLVSGLDPTENSQLSALRSLYQTSKQHLSGDGQTDLTTLAAGANSSSLVNILDYAVATKNTNSDELTDSDYRLKVLGECLSNMGTTWAQAAEADAQDASNRLSFYKIWAETAHRIKAGTVWRAYASGESIRALGSEVNKPSETLSVKPWTAIAADTNGYQVQAESGIRGNLYENELLEAVSASDQELARLEKTVTTYENFLASQQSASNANAMLPIVNEFYAVWGPVLAANYVSANQGVNWAEAISSGERQTTLTLTALANIDGTIAGLKDQIATQGTLFFSVRGSNDEDRLQLKNTLIKNAENAALVADKATGAWTDLLKTYDVAQAAYQESFADMQSKEATYNASVFAYQKAEAIKTYADSPYTNAPVDEAAAGNTVIDPATRMNTIFLSKASADAAFRVLSDIENNSEAVNDDFATRSPEYQSAYAAYRKHFSDVVAARKLQAFLDGQIATQTQRVETAQANFNNQLQTIASVPVWNTTWALNDGSGTGAEALDFADVTWSNGHITGYTMHKSREGNGNGEFAADNSSFKADSYRDHYFLSGGTIDLLVDSYGWSRDKASTAYASFQQSTGLRTGNDTYPQMIAAWSRDLALFSGENVKSLNSILEMFSRAMWATQINQTNIIRSQTLTPWTSYRTIPPVYDEDGNELSPGRTELVQGMAFSPDKLTAALLSRLDYENDYTRYFGFFAANTNGMSPFIYKEMVTRAQVDFSQIQQNSQLLRLFNDYVYLNTVGGGKAKTTFGDTYINNQFVLKLSSHAFRAPWVSHTYFEAPNDWQTKNWEKLPGWNDAEVRVYMHSDVSGEATRVLWNMVRVNSAYVDFASSIMSTANAYLEMEAEKTILTRLTGQPDFIASEPGTGNTAIPLTQKDLNRAVDTALLLSDQQVANLKGSTRLSILNGETDNAKAAYRKNQLATTIGIGSAETKEFELYAGDEKGVENLDTHLYRAYSSSLNPLVDLNSSRGLLKGLSNHATDLRAADTQKLQDVVKKLSATQVSKENTWKTELQSLDIQKLAAIYQKASYNSNNGTFELGNEEQNQINSLLLSLKKAGEAAFLHPDYRSRTHERRMFETAFELGNRVNVVAYPELLDLKKETFQAQTEWLTQLQIDRTANLKQIKQAQWDSLAISLETQKTFWLQAMDAIAATAKAAWDSATVTFNDAHALWQKKILAIIQRTNDAWAKIDNDLKARKDIWMGDLAIAVTKAGDQSALTNPSPILDDVVRRQLELASAKIDSQQQAQQIAEDLTANRLFDQLLSFGDSISARTGQGLNLQAQGFTTANTLGKTGILALVTRYQSEKRDEMEKQLLIIAARNALDSIKTMNDGIDAQISRSNNDIKEKIHDQASNSGFITNGTTLYKKVLVDATASGEIHEDAYIIDYINYQVDPSNKSVLHSLLGVTSNDLISKNTLGIEYFLDSVQKTIKKVQVDIFGDPKDPNKKGLFGTHVGTAPRLKASPDMEKIGNALEFRNNLDDAGSGQFGRILSELERYKLKEQKGFAEYNKPSYDRKLWQDSGSWLKAPSIRSLTTMAVGIIATVATGGLGVAGMLAAAGANIAADAVFTGLDVAHGKDARDAWGNFAIKSAGSLAGASLNALGVGSQIASSLGGSILAKAVGTVTSSVLSNATVGAIGSLNFLGGRLGFNADQYKQGLAGTGAMASYAGAFAGNLTGNALNASYGDEAGYFKASTSIASWAAAQTATYTVTLGSTFAHDGFSSSWSDMAKTSFDQMGGVSVNVADLGSIFDTLSSSSMLTGNFSGSNATNAGNWSRALSGTGLVLNLNSSGVTGKIAQGGFNLLGTASDLYNGLALRADAKMQAQLSAQAAGGEASDQMLSDDEIAQVMKNREAIMYTTLAKSYTFGDSTAVQTLKRMQAGSDKLRVGFDQSLTLAGYSTNEARAITTANQDGNRTIWLRSLSNGNESAIDLAHESYRNGTIGTRAEQAAETLQAVSAHTQMAQTLGYDIAKAVVSGRIDLAADLNAYNQGSKAFENYVAGNYDGSGDYWRLKKDGTLVNDHSRLLTVELADGTTKVMGDDETSTAAALVHYLGQERASKLLETSRTVSQAEQAKTYQDVLNISAAEAQNLVSNPAQLASRLANITPQQKDQITGELLMKGNGMSYSAANRYWTGQEADPNNPNAGFRLSDNRFDDYAIGMRNMGNNQYERFTVTGEATRSATAFSALQWFNNDWQSDPADPNRRNTTIAFTKRDLSGNVIGNSYTTPTSWNSVDVGWGQYGTADQSYNHVLLGKIQSNTVNSDYLLRLFNSSPDQVNTYGVATLGLITNASTIGGENIDNSGVVRSSALPGNATLPWLWHPTGNGWVDGCWATLNNVGFAVPQNYQGNPQNAWKDPNLLGSGANNFQQVTNYLKDTYGVYNGMNIRIRTNNQNPRAITGFGWR